MFVVFGPGELVELVVGDVVLRRLLVLPRHDGEGATSLVRTFHL